MLVTPHLHKHHVLYEYDCEFYVVEMNRTQYDKKFPSLRAMRFNASLVRMARSTRTFHKIAQLVSEQ